MGQPGQDWTIAMDDAMVERHSSCGLCGARRRARLLIRARGPLAIAVSLCIRCDRQDPQQVRLEALLAARYDPPRWEDGRPS
jgi:hypothetical protein